MCDNNYKQMVPWLMRFKLGIQPTARNIGTGLSLLYRANKLTEKNLSLAWAALKEQELVDVKAETPVATEVTDNPAATRRPRAGFGIRSRETTMQTQRPTADVPLTEAELNKLSDEEIRRL